MTTTGKGRFIIGGIILANIFLPRPLPYWATALLGITVGLSVFLIADGLWARWEKP